MLGYRMKFSGAVLVVLGWAWLAVAQPSQPVQPTEPTTEPLIETHRLVDQPDERVSVLNNGLTVILKAHRTAPVVSVRMYCRTGSIYEQEYLGSGMSHLFEHLLHGGATVTRTEEQSREILNSIGGDTNAFTSYDMTCYFINTARENVTTAVSLLSDWITRPTFPQAAFEREWGVVQRELERDVDDPDRQLFYLTAQTMYREHPVRFPVIGWQPIVQKLTKQDIVNYHRRMYVPDNIVVCVVGDIDVEAVLTTVRQEFASCSRQPVRNIVLPEEPPMVTPRMVVKRMAVQAAMLNLCWPSIRLTDPDMYALDVLSYVLSEGNSSRLNRTVRDPGLVYAVETSSWTPAWVNGLFAVSARLDPQKQETATAAILEQIALIQKEGIAPEELAQAQQQKAAEHVFANQTAEQIAGMYAADFLSTGDVHFSQAYVDHIRQVTVEQIRDVARKYLVPERMGTILILPEQAPSSTTEKAMASEPVPVEEMTLENGLRVLIRRDPTTPLAVIQSFSLGGVLYETEQTNGLSNLAALLATRGTPTRSAEQIARFFDSRGGGFAGASGNNSIYFRSQVLKDDFAGAMEVFGDVLCNASFPSEELERLRPRVLDGIKQIDESWRSELQAYFKKRFFGDSPYRFEPIGSPEVVAQTTREQVAEFFHQRVTGPTTVLAIFGDVDVEQARELARKHFNALPNTAGRKVVSPGKSGSSSPRLYIKQKSPERKAAGIEIGFPGMLLTDKADMANMAVLDTVISGYRLPTGWLHEALRGGDAKYVYEVHAVNMPGVLPGVFLIYAACEPDKINDVYRIITEQLDKARQGKFTAEELERAKVIIQTAELMEQQTNSERAMQTALDTLYGMGPNYRQEFLKAIQGVTLDDLTKMANQYFTAPTVTIVTPDVQQVDIGLKPIAVDSDAAVSQR